MKRKKHMGRPFLPKAQRRSVRLTFRMTAGLHKALGAAAKAQGKTLGTYVNDILENAVKGGE